jgi:hypothetical protein
MMCAAVSSVHSLPGRYVTVAWDPSPDERVVGYAVFVGTVSQNYDKVFLVRNHTHFTFAEAVPDQRYYFSVVAFTDELVSDRSEEVSGFGQSTPALPVFDDFALQSAPLGAPTLHATRGLTCTDADRSGCDRTSILGVMDGVVDALAAPGDGRLLVVENGQRIRVFDGRAWSRDAALVAPANVTFLGVAVDPSVDRRVYVAEAQNRADGTRDVRIVRYREVQGTLGEPAVIVAGIQAPANGSAPLAVDPKGRIFVAVPSLEANTNASTGIVLGFESDGSALVNNRAASPVLAYTAFAPASMTWDGIEQVWLTGLQGTRPTVSRIPTNPLTGSERWPRVPLAAGFVAPDAILPASLRSGISDTPSTPLLRLAVGGRVVNVIPGGNEFTEDAAFANQEITAAATDRVMRSSYVAVRSSGVTVTYIYRIRD